MTTIKSPTFAHGKQVQKLIQKDYVLGYVVVAGGRGGGPRVWPIYRGDVYVKTKDRRGKPLTHVFSTYEQGENLNGQHYEDPVGSQLASIAATAIATLEEMKRARDYKAEAKTPTKRKK